MEQAVFEEKFRALRKDLRIKAEKGELSLDTFDLAVIAFFNQYLELHPNEKGVRNFRDSHAMIARMDPFITSYNAGPQALELVQALSDLNAPNKHSINALRDTVITALAVRHSRWSK